MSIATALLALSAMPEDTGAAEELDETIAVEPGGTLSIDLDRGQVTIHSHDANVVHLTATARGFGAQMGGFELERRGNDVHLEGSFAHSISFVPWGPRVRVEAAVPRQYSVVVQTHGGAVRISEITGRTIAETTGGAIHVEGCRGQVSVETSGGPIRVGDIDGLVVARTSGGSIEMNRVSGGIEAVTSGGALALHEIGGGIQARTSGGAIAASFARAPVGEMETSGGRIDVSFAADAKVDLDAETSGGRVEVEHLVASTDSRSKHRVVGRINGGGAPVRLKTSGGNIRVRAR
jgi:hypothetical protein